MKNPTKAMVLPRNTEWDNEVTRNEKTATIRENAELRRPTNLCSENQELSWLCCSSVCTQDGVHAKAHVWRLEEDTRVLLCSSCLVPLRDRVSH